MSETTETDKPRVLFREWAKRFLLDRFSVAVCGGTRHRDYLLSLGMPRHRIFMKYDVVDNDYFSSHVGHPVKRSCLPGLSDQRPFFLASSRFVSRKNLSTLLIAYRLYRSRAPAGWALVLLGSGDQEQALRRQVEADSIRDVTFAGFRQIEELPLYYASTRCFIHPARTEPWGLVVNEAMASSLPVLVSNGVGCVTDLVEHGGNGFVFDPSRPEELAEYMFRVAGDDSLQQTMAARSREIIAQWTIRDFAESLWRAYQAPDRGYRLIALGGRKIVAYPEGGAVRKIQHLRAIRASTARRRVLLGGIALAGSTHFDRILFKRVRLDDERLFSPDLCGALTQMSENLGVDDLQFTLAWPPEMERKRLYAYGYREGGQPEIFVKLVSSNDGECLKNGFETLVSLPSPSDHRIRFPRPLLYETYRQIQFYVTEFIPQGKRSDRGDRLTADDLIRSYAGSPRDVSPEELTHFAWIRRFWERIDADSRFASLLRVDQTFPLRCQRVHGDLTRANVILSGKQTWIIDWELSDAMAPQLTDVITFFLSARQRAIVAAPSTVFHEFNERFIEGKEGAEQRAARLALGFLYGANSGFARRMVDIWNAGER